MKTPPAPIHWETTSWLLALGSSLVLAVMCLALPLSAQSATDGADLTSMPASTVGQVIVDAGQAGCYSASAEIACPTFYGQDTQSAGQAPSYTLSVNGLGTGAHLAFGRAGGWQKARPGPDPQGDVQRAASHVRLVRDVDASPTPTTTAASTPPPPRTSSRLYLPVIVTGAGRDTPGFTIQQTLSDGAQRNTIAFDGLAFLTGNLGSDSFFPPGKVADFWGFQYLRDNDPSGMGHNTDFLTKASLNMLYVLTADQKAQLTALAKSQVADINQYGYKRFVLMSAFRRLLEGSLPAGTTELNTTAVMTYSAELYRLDGEISFARAQVMGTILHNLSASQKAYLDGMVGKGMTSWPTVDEPAELRGLGRDEKVAVMTYAGDMFSWYAGSIEADVYFCPERQGTYFGSFYMKDAPAVGNPGYTIPTTLTAELGATFLQILTPTQASHLTALVNDQKPALYEIVDRREDVSVLLRQFMSGGVPDEGSVLSLMERYGALDGEIVARYAIAFAQVGQSLSAEQHAQLVKMRTDLLGGLAYPSGAYLYSRPIAMPAIPNTDFLFTTR